MSTIEFHSWNATAPDLDRPDRVVLDLDPDPALPCSGRAWWKATTLTLNILDELGLKSFSKTSGGKRIRPDIQGGNPRHQGSQHVEHP
jgi:bifunctional non-homologous end joining protein LigD